MQSSPAVMCYQHIVNLLLVMMVLTIWFLMNRQRLPTAAASSVGKAPGVNHFSAGHFLTRHFQSDCGGQGANAQRPQPAYSP
jgi:hypothetical protein